MEQNLVQFLKNLVLEVLPSSQTFSSQGFRYIKAKFLILKHKNIHSKDMIILQTKKGDVEGTVPGDFVFRK